MKYSNIIHNILNVLIAAVSISEVADLNVFFTDPEVGPKVIAGLAISKLLINAIRDGIDGMFKEQPPVR